MSSTRLVLRMKDLKDLPVRIVRRMFQRGPFDTLSRITFRLYEAFREGRLSIETREFIHWYDLGDDPESVDYEPIGYRTLDRALAHAPLIECGDAFLDYGCGQGRVVVTAAQRPYSRVIGVESSESLCAQAANNVARARRIRCAEVDIINTAAQSYTVPAEVKVIFLFNPFTGTALAKTLAQVRRSLKKTPRQLTILYVLPQNAENQLDQLDWLKQTVDRPSQGLRLTVYKSALRCS